MTKTIIKYKSCTELKDIARQRLTGKYGTTLLFYLLKAVLLLFIFQSVWSYMFGMIIMGLLDLGISFFYLNAACGQPTSANDMFYGFSRDVAKYAVISAMVGGLKLLCMAPYYIALMFTPVEVEAMSSSLVIFMLAISIILYVPVSLMISQVYFLILDFPDYTALDVFRHSFRIMKKQIGRLFYLKVSFIPMFLLAVLTFGIGLLWVLPYAGMTSACFFMDIMNPTREKIEVEDVPAEEDSAAVEDAAGDSTAEDVPAVEDSSVEDSTAEDSGFSSETPANPSVED